MTQPPMPGHLCLCGLRGCPDEETHVRQFAARQALIHRTLQARWFRVRSALTPR